MDQLAKRFTCRQPKVTTTYTGRSASFLFRFLYNWGSGAHFRHPRNRGRTLGDPFQTRREDAQRCSDLTTPPPAFAPDCGTQLDRNDGLLRRNGEVAVALANKMARIAWALLAKGDTYRVPVLAAAA